MLKTLLGLAAGIVLMTSASAHAADISDEVMALLVRESGNITLVHSDGDVYGEAYQLPHLIARQLHYSYYKPPFGEVEATFARSKVECEPSKAKDVPVGVINYDCTAVFSDNTYAVKRGGVIGKELSGSGVFMKFRVSRDISPGAPLFLPVKRIVATLAG